MKAVCWHGQGDMRVDTVDDHKIEHSRDAIIKITATAICGSDLHLFDGYMPMMEEGDIVGHEPMGEVVEVGADVKNLQKGDRVVVPFNLACGECWFCSQKLFSVCDNSNRKKENAVAQMGHSPSGLLGYSHVLGGYAGGQAEYLRVPYADMGPIKVPDGLDDEKVLFISDIFPTGYQAAEQCGIEPGDTVAVWGCGPVGQFAIKSAWMFGAKRVIAIDTVAERLALAKSHSNAETLDPEQGDIYERLMEMTNGFGPDRCIDAVGAEAHAAGGVKQAVDSTKETAHMQSDRPYVMAEIIKCCRKAGTVSVPGVYIDGLNLPWGAAMNKALTFRMGQTHTHRYLKPLMDKVQAGEIDPSFLITHRHKLDQAPEAYKKFRDRTDGCIKVVLTP